MDNTGKVQWKIKPLISISSVPPNDLHCGYFVQFTHFEIDKETRQLIAYGINNAKAFVDISTGETIKQL